MKKMMKINKILEAFKAHTKRYKEQYKKTREQLDSLRDKYNELALGMEKQTKKIEYLESDVLRKNNEIIDITNKRLSLYIEKERLKEDLNIAKGHEIIEGLTLKKVR